jgi:hypothetical protein
MSDYPWLFLINAAILPFVLSMLSRWGSVAVRWGLITTAVWLDATIMLWRACRLSTIGYLLAVVALSALSLPSEMTRSIGERWSKTRFGVFLLAFFTAAGLIHVHLPISTFLTSPGEVGIHLDNLLTSNTTDAMVVVYAGLAIYSLAVVPKMRTTLSMIALTTTALLLIYAYALPFGYPMMNGLMFEQIPLTRGTLLFRATLDLGVVFVVAACSGQVALKAKPRHIVAGLLLINLSLVTSTLYAVKSDQPSLKEAESTPKSAQPLRFSREQPNVLIVFLDRFMGGFVEEIIKSTPRIESDLTGFTWYPRTVAAGENSIAGVHPIFGGYDYTPQRMNERESNLKTLSVEAYRLLPHNFSKKGYHTNFVNPRGLGFTMSGDCSLLNDIENMNCTHVPAHVSSRMAAQHGVSLQALSQANYSDLLSLLAAMRALPYLMKGVLHEKGPWRPFLDHSAGTTFKQWAELAALPSLTNVDATESNLNIFWNILPHEPYFMGEDCRPRSVQLDASAEELTQGGYSSLFEYQHAIAARCSLLLVVDYFNWMKVHHIYDNTKIVIVSDHGIVGPVEDRSSRAREGGTTDNLYVRSRSVLFVKERQATGELRIREDFLPNAEVPRIVCEEIGGCVNPYIGGRPIETDGRDDPFLVDFVPWQFNRQKPDGFVIKQRLQLNGRDPYSRAGWQEMPLQ